MQINDNGYMFVDMMFVVLIGTWLIVELTKTTFPALHQQGVVQTSVQQQLNALHVVGSTDANWNCRSEHSLLVYCRHRMFPKLSFPVIRRSEGHHE